MKILRLSMQLIITLLMVVPIDASAHCKGKHTGNHPHCSGGDPPPDPGASSCPGDFPALAYAIEITNKRGHTVRSDLKVSNAAGSCEVLVHSVTSADTYDDLTFNFDSVSDKYRIAYNYESDDTDTRKGGARPNIRVMEFSVSDDLGETKIDQTLPLQIHKIYRYSGNSTAGRAIFGMDLSGDSLVFTEIDGPPTINKIKIIESVENCISNLGPEPDDSCAGPDAFQSSPTPENPHLGAVFPRWGLDTSRIYFHYQGYGPNGNDSVLAFIDRSGPTSWSAPGAVRDLSTDGGDFFHGTVALWNHDGSGPSEVVTATVGGALQILDIGDSCTAVVSGTTSCLVQGLATIVNLQTQAPHGRWTTNTTIDSGPNLLFFDNNSINELDPDSGIDALIIGDPGTSWWWFDPVD